MNSHVSELSQKNSQARYLETEVTRPSRIGLSPRILGRLRQENQKFKAGLGSLVRPPFKKKKSEETTGDIAQWYSAILNAMETIQQPILP